MTDKIIKERSKAKMVSHTSRSNSHSSLPLITMDGVSDDPEISFDEQYRSPLHSPNRREGGQIRLNTPLKQLGPVRMTTLLALWGNYQGEELPYREAPNARRMSGHKGSDQIDHPLQPLGDDQ